MIAIDDAIQAHSWGITDNNFLSRAQLVADVLQNTTGSDKSTAGCFDPEVFVNCVQDPVCS